MCSESEFASEQAEDAVGFSGPLTDRVEIRELYETYVDAVAMNDAELWASTWVDDCVWHIAGQTTEGKDETVALWKQFMDSFSRALFSGFIGSVAIDDDTATGRYHTVEELWPNTGGVQRLQGRYADEMVRRDGRWLFKSRTYIVVQEVPITVPDQE